MTKKIWYKLNITPRFMAACKFAFDSETPFPAIHPNDEILIKSKSYKVTAVRHQISEGKDIIDWITIVAANAAEESEL
jgi:hypothetical protein